MAQDIFEKQAREKLAHREIQPSNQSWNRLEQLLDQQEQPKKRFFYWWIAASIVGIFILVNFFDSSETNEESLPTKVVVKELKQTETSIKTMGQPDLIPSSPNVTSKNHSVAIVQPEMIKKTIPTSTRSEGDRIHQEVKVTEDIVANQNVVKSSEIQLNEKPAITSATKIKVDPNLLLSQVDGELELSFREKVIAKVNQNYQTVKVALANRNNQE